MATKIAKYVLADQLPHGATAMLLYACYTGYNQEDSIIVNLDAVERGFFNTLFFRTYSDNTQKHRSVTIATERFTKPDRKTTRDTIGKNYNAIDENGRPIVADSSMAMKLSLERNSIRKNVKMKPAPVSQQRRCPSNRSPPKTQVP